jgi:YidC/Oxa1 family membrane protein insertase
MDDQNKNLILATALSVLVILGWMWLFPPAPPVPTDPAQATRPLDGVAPIPGAADSTAQLPTLAVTREESRAAALAKSARLPIDTPRLKGSISLRGGRIDDLALKDYRVTIDPRSDLVTLLSPAEGPEAYYALYGWAPAGDLDPARA